MKTTHFLTTLLVIFSLWFANLSSAQEVSEEVLEDKLAPQTMAVANPSSFWGLSLETPLIFSLHSGMYLNEQLALRVQGSLSPLLLLNIGGDLMYYETTPQDQGTHFYTGIGANIVFSPLLGILGALSLEPCPGLEPNCNPADSSLLTGLALAAGPLVGVEGPFLGMPMFAELHLDVVLSYVNTGLIPTLSMGWRYSF
ncbi:MAG: hypothetical protein R2880_06665 [Deinococcales bacterium]